MLGAGKRDLLYGDVLENNNAARMIHDGRHKLIWYPAGNRVQLFDLDVDPGELSDAADMPEYHQVRERLETALGAASYGKDVDEGWVKGGKLAGHDPGPYVGKPDRSFSAQRGLHYPQPPAGEVPDHVGFPD